MHTQKRRADDSCCKSSSSASKRVHRARYVHSRDPFWSYFAFVPPELCAIMAAYHDASLDLLVWIANRVLYFQPNSHHLMSDADSDDVICRYLHQALAGIGTDGLTHIYTVGPRASIPRYRQIWMASFAYWSLSRTYPRFHLPDTCHPFVRACHHLKPVCFPGMRWFVRETLSKAEWVSTPEQWQSILSSEHVKDLPMLIDYVLAHPEIQCAAATEMRTEAAKCKDPVPRIVHAMHASRAAARYATRTYGKEALIAAVRLGMLWMADWLLERGVSIHTVLPGDPNVRGDEPRSLLDLAFDHGGDCAALLLRHGADPFSAVNSRTCVHPVTRMFRCESYELADMLLDAGLTMDMLDPKSEPALHSITADMRVARALLKRGADVRAIDDGGYDVLSNLIERMGPGKSFEGGDLSILIDAGADVNAINPQNDQTPLTPTFTYNNKRVFELLVARGADTNYVRKRDGATYVHSCVYYDTSTEMLGTLVARGANLNARMTDENGYTPLHMAISRGHTHYVTWLLAHDADPNILDGKGNTPLMLALTTEFKDNTYRLTAVAALAMHPNTNVQIQHGVTKQEVWMMCNHPSLTYERTVIMQRLSYDIIAKHLKEELA